MLDKDSRICYQILRAGDPAALARGGMPVPIFFLTQNGQNVTLSLSR